MDFVFGVLQVVIGAFILFWIARSSISYALSGHERGWFVLLFISTLVMVLIHRYLSHGISVPFYTAILFWIVVSGMVPEDGSPLPDLLRKGRWSIVVGTLVGWVFYVEIVG